MKIGFGRHRQEPVSAAESAPQEFDRDVDESVDLAALESRNWRIAVRSFSRLSISSLLQ